MDDQKDMTNIIEVPRGASASPTSIELDNLEAVRKLDTQNVYGSVVAFPQQCVDAYVANESLVVPESYKAVDKIVMAGMGGSGLGADVIKSALGSKKPLEIVNDYNLPEWVDGNTLVVCSSYSGTTEETLENARQAKEKGANLMIIGAGGALVETAREQGVPFYQIDPVNNPSKQPRMAVGYSIIGQLAMLAKTGLIDLSRQDVDGIVGVMNAVQDKSKIETQTSENPAKQMAEKLQGKQVIFVAGRELSGAAHVAKNQMNENAKNLSTLHLIPELNHHLMEGLRFPNSNKDDIVFLFVDSDLYPERIKQRMDITKKIVEENGIGYVAFKPESGNHLSQSFELMQFCAFTNFYLSMLNGIDPAPIPWVDKFKTELGQPLGDFK